MINYKRHIISITATIRDALKQLDELSCAKCMVLFGVDNDGRLIGTITDGDLRRALLNGADLTTSLTLASNKNFAFLESDKIDLKYIKYLRSIDKTIVPLLDSLGRVVKVYDFNQRKTILPIDVVLMAGGRGERLRPLTDSVPKPLLKVGDKAIIDHNVDRLITFGVETYFVTVNYLADKMVTHFKDSKELKGIEVVCVHEPKPLGTIGSLTLVQGLKNATVLLMNSDLFTNIDYDDFYQDFINKNADMSIATIPYNVDIPYAVMDLDGDQVVSFQEKPTITYYANAGVYLIKRELLNIIPQDVKFDATDFMEVLIKMGKHITRYPIVGYWVDIGKPQDYAKVQEFVKHLET